MKKSHVLFSCMLGIALLFFGCEKDDAPQEKKEGPTAEQIETMRATIPIKGIPAENMEQQLKLSYYYVEAAAEHVQGNVFHINAWVNYSLCPPAGSTYTIYWEAYDYMKNGWVELAVQTGLTGCMEAGQTILSVNYVSSQNTFMHIFAVIFLETGNGSVYWRDYLTNMVFLNH